MDRLNVNPTRMVLTNLKKQLRVAVRGHKLMKDKRDELMKRFLDLARENKKLREEVEASLTEVYQSFSIASAVMTPAMMAMNAMFITPIGTPLACATCSSSELNRSGR